MSSWKYLKTYESTPAAWAFRLDHAAHDKLIERAMVQEFLAGHRVVQWETRLLKLRPQPWKIVEEVRFIEAKIDGSDLLAWQREAFDANISRSVSKWMFRQQESLHKGIVSYVFGTRRWWSNVGEDLIQEQWGAWFKKYNLQPPEAKKEEELLDGISYSVKVSEKALLQMLKQVGIIPETVTNLDDVEWDSPELVIEFKHTPLWKPISPTSRF